MCDECQRLAADPFAMHDRTRMRLTGTEYRSPASDLPYRVAKWYTCERCGNDWDVQELAGRKGATIERWILDKPFR